MVATTTTAIAIAAATTTMFALQYTPEYMVKTAFHSNSMLEMMVRSNTYYGRLCDI